MFKPILLVVTALAAGLVAIPLVSSGVPPLPAAAPKPMAASSSKPAADNSSQVKVVPAPTEYVSIPLRSDGSEKDELWKQYGSGGGYTVTGVTQPAIYPVLPKPGEANGTAVIIAPGGGFFQLSMSHEGFQVAQYLADRGITAFVLKYRLKPVPTGAATMNAESDAKSRYIEPDAAALKAMEDGLASMKYVREHAVEYKIEPHYIGFMGFSAGARTTMNVTMNYDAATRPDFIGVLYGTMPEKPAPLDAPPAFVACAADDPARAWASTPIYEAWRLAGKSVELHIYAHGKHGFGMQTRGTTSDRWIEDYYNWLKIEILKK